MITREAVMETFELDTKRRASFASKREEIPFKSKKSLSIVPLNIWNLNSLLKDELTNSLGADATQN